MRHADFEKSLMDTALGCGAADAGVTAADSIVFRREFRAACEQNLCGKFGKCWMCPPDVGDIDEMIARAKTYSRVLVFSTIGQLEDSYDIEGMQDAARKHNALIQTIAGKLSGMLEDPLILGAGSCHVCTRCAKLDNIPCVHPDKAVPSLEAHGIAVSQLAEICGMNYINGQNTVTYFGGVLF